MTQIHKSRHPDNPYIDTIWATKNTDNGVYMATPDGSWDLIVMIYKDSKRHMVITGQATEPKEIPYEAGTGSVVISFAPGAYMPKYPAEQLLNSFEVLPDFDENHFMIAGHTFAYPTYENAEKLVERLVELKILKNDLVVNGELTGSPRAMSDRAKQQHFSKTTGMSKAKLQQIKRAQEAVRLLQQGKKPIEAATEAGYTDQPHLAKSLKKIMHAKPSDVTDIHKL